MSSEEEEPSSPRLPKDSDRGSSVSSELQDEYEELLRYAVVAPKIETFTSVNLQRLSASHLPTEVQISQRKDGARSPRPADGATESQHGRSGRNVRASPSPLIVEPLTYPRASHAEEMAGQPPSVDSDTPSDRVQTTSERPDSPDLPDSTVTEMFISDENISRVENILDTWSSKLKANVLDELRKWKQAFAQQHMLEMKREREKQAAQAAGLRSELDSLKELLHTYETSSQRKDEVIMNLSQVLDRQTEKIEKMKAFSHWRVKHTETKEEAHSAQVAQQHYHMQLKRKVWLAWHSLVQRHWKVQVEQACRSRAEEVCTRLSAEYESKLREHCDAIQRAQAEVQKLRMERERNEESMKTAFMRGVCALNMEALHIFHSDGRVDQPAVRDQFDLHRDDPGAASLAHLQPYPSSTARLSPVHFDRSETPYPSDGADMGGYGASASRAEGIAPTTVMHSSLPLGGAAGIHRQFQTGGRVVTAAQQKPAKTVTARITARPDSSKATRSNLQVMGVTPPMSSVIVERHHPVTQLTIGQATAAKFPRSSQQQQQQQQQQPSSSGGRGSSRTHTGSCHVHSIKVVD